MRTATLLLLTGVVLGCGGAAKNPQTSREVDVKPVAAEAQRAAGRRTASKEVLAAWPLEHPMTVVYADVGGLLKTKLFSGLVGGLMTLAGGNFPPAQRKCIDVALDGWKEVAFGFEDERSLAVVRFDPASQKGMAECAKGFADSGTAKAADKAVTVDGAPAAWSLGENDVAALAPGLFVAGHREVVTKALTKRSTGASLAGLGLAADEYVTFVAEMPKEHVRARGTLLASDQRFRIGVEADLPEEAIAQKIDEMFNGGMIEKRFPLAGEEGRLLGRLVKATTLKRTGKKIEAAFDLQEGVEEQARDIGIMATLAISGVRKYIANAKQAEARNTLGQLAKDVVAWWETEDPKTPMAKKKLVSFPAVPKIVPKATKVQTTDADWKPWAPLHFTMMSPQYYQYEIKAAKDGESAEIIAHGDLDGNGKTSTFKISLKVRRPDNTLLVAPQVEELDPEE